MQPVSNPGQSDPQAFQRTIRILYFALFAAVGIYWFVLETMRPEAGGGDVGILRTVFLGLAGTLAAVVLYLRLLRIPPLLDDSRTELAQRIPRLWTFYILCFALSEAIALYGFLFGFLGGSRAETGVFFAAALALFLLCYPQSPQG